MKPNYKDIKTFDDACKALNIENKLPDYSMAPANMQKHLLAAYQLPIIIGALNGNWTPDWSDRNYKFMPYFWLNDKSAPDGFSLYIVVGYFSFSYVGSRLCFQSRELANYAVEQFFDIYKDYYLI